MCISLFSDNMYAILITSYWYVPDVYDYKRCRKLHFVTNKQTKKLDTVPHVRLRTISIVAGFDSISLSL